MADNIALLPLFREEAKSPAMIRHSMDIVKNNVEFLNPGQIPVVAFDQPLFALAKITQWNWPERYGEEKFIVMLGGLHIEMASWKTLGDWLDNTGWTSLLVDANFCTSGKADSFLKASHVSRTRYAHQVTACCLFTMMYKAYQQSICLNPADSNASISFEQWRSIKAAENPQFKFWSIVLELELCILNFVQSLRQGDFNLYVKSLMKIVPWFFALDHHHYARWVPVHIRDMVTLKKLCPAEAHEFENGHFVVKKSVRPFSKISLDHAHEQNNKSVKGDGGAIGLTENSAELLRWMVSGPEISRMINEFETSQELISVSEKNTNKHHEDTVPLQTKFLKDVKSLCVELENKGNPFLEDSKDVLNIDTKEIMGHDVVTTVNSIEAMGERRYKEFVEERLDKKTVSLFETIKKNKVSLFSTPTAKETSKHKMQLNSVKQECAMFGQLYISCQVRGGDLDDFFRHENRSYPPSLSQFGTLSTGTKSTLVERLEALNPSVTISTDNPLVEALILDGAAVVNFLKATNCETFADYARDVFIKYVKSQLNYVQRVDIVWDRYLEGSLKATTRNKRGKGVRRRVLPDTRIPKNWSSFLRNEMNKKELFAFLAEEVTRHDYSPKIVISTCNEEVKSSSPRNLSSLSPCLQEEADTRMLLHVADCCKDGHKRVKIRTVDTDVLVIAISLFHQVGAEELWLEFSTGKHTRFISVHGIVNALGPEKSAALIAFHALTGCDQTSFFSGRGKVTAWETWKLYPEVTNTFKLLSNMPSQRTIMDAVPSLERFVILLYDRTSTITAVNEARKQLFTKKGRSIDALPPTSDALLQHVKRSAYQAGHVWSQSLCKNALLPSPSDWGWVQDNQLWQPFWMTLPEVSKDCSLLIKCGCNPQRGCRMGCKCVKANLPCTALCKCNGDCERLQY